MQRKLAPGFPANSCSIRMPESGPGAEAPGSEEQDGDLQQRRRQQLINFAHSHWGFNNWSWAVTKQELDFVDFSNGKYSAGVVAFVSVSVKSLDISREDIGYATTLANMKGSAIFQARKCAVTNALRETLLSFGGNIATDLTELLESQKTEATKPHAPEPAHENNQNIANKAIEPLEPKNAISRNIRKDSSDSGGSREAPAARSPHKNTLPPPAVKPMPAVVPVAKTQPMPANLPPQILVKPTFPANQIPPKPPTMAATVGNMGGAGGASAATGAPLTHVRPNSNDASAPTDGSHTMTEEELRAERKRRQRQAQEEFRIKQLQKQNTHPIDGDTDSDTADNLLMDIHTQQLMEVTNESSKRKYSDNTLSLSKRRNSTNKLDDQS